MKNRPQNRTLEAFKNKQNNYKLLFYILFKIATSKQHRHNDMAHAMQKLVFGHSAELEGPVQPGYLPSLIRTLNFGL